MIVSLKILAIVAGIGLVLILVAPLYSLLLLDLLLAPVQRHTELAGVLLDQTDLIFALLALGWVLRSRLGVREMRAQVPYFWLWVTLGGLLSLVYLTAPINQPYLTAFHRAVYQVYRASWKPILYFPLAAILLNTLGRSQLAVATVVLAGDFCSLYAIPQGYEGFRAGGPFPTGNTLGAVLIVPFVAAFAKLVFPHTIRQRWFYGGSLLLCGRALLFARSRGAFAGVLAGILLILAFLALRSTGRSRLLRLFPVAIGLVLLVFALKPDVMQRPNVQRLLTLSDPMEERTMQWRVENRWNFYWEKSWEKPWLGHGTDIDRSLVKISGAKTPHNSYLSLVVENGYPTAILYLLLLSLSIARSLKFYRSQSTTPGGLQGLLLAAGIVGILVHFMADSIINLPYVSKTLWLFAGLAASLPMVAQAEESETENSVEMSSENGIELPLRPAARTSLSNQAPST